MRNAAGDRDVRLQQVQAFIEGKAEIWDKVDGFTLCEPMHLDLQDLASKVEVSSIVLKTIEAASKDKVEMIEPAEPEGDFPFADLSHTKRPVPTRTPKQRVFTNNFVGSKRGNFKRQRYGGESS